MTTKERPIIFDGESVRAILAGTKTQTRRVVKHPTINRVTRVHSYKGQTEFDLIMGDESGTVIACPHGKPDDHLWVRESCQAEELEDGLDGVRYLADNTFREIGNSEEAAHDFLNMYYYGLQESAPVPPIHTPRWASRITLQVMDIRVERVQAITSGDAKAEGIDAMKFPHEWLPAYAERWDSINAKRGYSWMMNPWVWVVEFKVI